MPIIFNEPVENKVASATSVYPAVIINISELSGINVRLWFFCPATMPDQQPKDIGCSNNYVDAPIKPHNGAEDYDFKIGGIIYISYADGNLNSPQFVRYAVINEDIIKLNARFIKDGILVLPEKFIDFEDSSIDLSSDILQEVVIYLLKYLSYLSPNNNYFELVPSVKSGILDYGLTYVYSDSNLIYYKFGTFGIELISNKNRPCRLNGIDDDSSGFLGYDWSNGNSSQHIDIMNFMTPQHNNRNSNYIYENNAPFQTFCKYVFNGGTSSILSNPSDLISNRINRLNSELHWKIENISGRYEYFTNVLNYNADEATSLLLLSTFAGYQFWPDSRNLNSRIYNANKNILDKNDYDQYHKNDLGTYTNAAYCDDSQIYLLYTYPNIEEFNMLEANPSVVNENIYLYNRKKLLESFCGFYYDEIKRWYAIKLFNCVYKIKNTAQSVYEVKGNGIILLMLAVIATSFTVLEKAIVDSNRSIIKELNIKNGNNLWKILDDFYKNSDSELPRSVIDNLNAWTIETIASMLEMNDYAKTKFKNVYSSKLNACLTAMYDNRKVLESVFAISSFTSPTVPTVPSIPDSSEYYWPVDGMYNISSAFGYRTYWYNGRWVSDYHLGVDVFDQSMIYGEVKARATKSGTVITADSSGVSSYGKYVLLQHNDGTYSLYAHLKELLVNQNDKISRKQQIGIIDSTGNVTGPHLHFEIRNTSNVQINPLDCFPNLSFTGDTEPHYTQN